jgi:hypothetical protein
MNTLTLTYAPEDNWHGELHASWTTPASGEWLSMVAIEKLTDFCDRLGDYPLDGTSFRRSRWLLEDAEETR